MGEYLIVDGRDGQFGVTLLRLGGEGTFFEDGPDPTGLLWSDVLPGLWIDPTWFTEDPMPDPFAIGDRMLATGTSESDG